ncbi:MAG: hypothetical protein AB1540_15710 [Bdellovibrionota bacterium]
MDDKNYEGAIQWERVIKRLMRYAHYYACKKAGFKVNETNAEDIISIGISPSDLMSSVITDFIDGKIPPNPTKLLTENYLVNLLRKAYREELMSFFRSPRVKTTKYMDEIERYSKDGEKIEEPFLSTYKVEKIRGVDQHQIIGDPVPQPDEDLDYEAELRVLYQISDGDPEVQEMIKAICEHDLETPREIATFLKTTAQDIYNRKKRMRRMYEDLRQSYRERKKAV